MVNGSKTKPSMHISKTWKKMDLYIYIYIYECLSLTLEQGSMVSSLAAIRATQPSTTLFRYTIGVLPINFISQRRKYPRIKLKKQTIRESIHNSWSNMENMLYQSKKLEIQAFLMKKHTSVASFLILNLFSMLTVRFSKKSKLNCSLYLQNLKPRASENQLWTKVHK